MLKIQTVLIPRTFTLKMARAWIKLHKYKLTFRGKPVDITTYFYRFRQAAVRPHARYFTQVLPNGVELVFMK
jgi:hypothetical protein